MTESPGTGNGTGTPPPLPAEKETPWIDAWIRWERDSKEIVGGEEDEEEEEYAEPTETFSFSYAVPKSLRGDGSQNINADDKKKNDYITLELKGFPSESEQIWNSTGLTLWHCSHYLSEWLMEHPELFQNKSKIVELGSGLGRCGLLAYHLLMHHNNTSRNNATKIAAPAPAAPSHVFLTDGDTDTLRQLRQNVIHNMDKNISISSSGDNEICKNPTISCHQLLWGEESAREFCQRHATPPATTTERISNDESDEEASQSTTNNNNNNHMDVVFGSDLVYVPGSIEPLFTTACALLQNNPHGIFILAYSDRRKGCTASLQMVLEGADAAGMDHEMVLEEDHVYILVFRRRAVVARTK